MDYRTVKKLYSLLFSPLWSAAIVTDVFQGSMRIFTKKLPHPDLVSWGPSCLFCPKKKRHGGGTPEVKKMNAYLC